MSVSTGVPLIALCWYSFMFVALLAAKKNKIIYSFMLILIVSMTWSGGSMMMRMQLYPGVVFWYQVSIGSMFLIPYCLYCFVRNFIGAKGYILRIVWGIGTVACVISTWTYFFLKDPTVQIDAYGEPVFVYHMDWTVVFPLLFVIVVIISTILMVVKEMKSNEMSGSAMAPLMIGILLLLLGNGLQMSEFLGQYPVDTASGIFNAALLFYALYRKRLFKLSLLVSRGTLFAGSAVISAILFANLIQPFEAFITSDFPQLVQYRTLIIAILFAFITLALYKIISKITDGIFIKEEQVYSQHLKQFSQTVSKSLNLNEIMEELLSVIQRAVDIDKGCICMYNSELGAYTVSSTLSPLASKNFLLKEDHPCIAYLKEHDGCLLLKEFQKTTAYKSMWEQEKNTLKEIGIECFAGLKRDNELIGAILLSKKKERNGQFSFDDLNFIDSITSTASIAVKNANLYQKAYYEARIDDLTKLLNRKYFHETINREFEKAKDSSLALAIINVDDFKLYNQLYGNHEGDVALQKIAYIISSCCDHKGFAARYSGKEFALILPNFDPLQTLRLTEDIKEQIHDMNLNGDADALKIITVSVGICVYPYAASNVEQLIANADMATYHAKRGGKNRIEVYSVDKDSSAVGEAQKAEEREVYSDYVSTIYALTAAIDAKDHYTFSHSQNVAKYSTILAGAIGLNKDHIQLIYEAALLHDIGKISIPEQILAKPGKLTDEEYKIMKRHVENSVSMIRHIPSLDYIIPAAIGHHERWDGKGYPRGISGENIPISARCLAIADAFDAMTTNRPYKQEMTVEEAVKEIEAGAGTQFDPKLADVFVKLVKNNLIEVTHIPVPNMKQ